MTEIMPGHPDYYTPVTVPPHFICTCNVCAKRLDTSQEPVYPGSKPWTWRCTDHQVSEEQP